MAEPIGYVVAVWRDGRCTGFRNDFPAPLTRCEAVAERLMANPLRGGDSYTVEPVGAAPAPEPHVPEAITGPLGDALRMLAEFIASDREACESGPGGPIEDEDDYERITAAESLHFAAAVALRKLAAPAPEPEPTEASDG